MTDRKPDFWVIKSNSADMGYFERPGVWTRNKKTRARFSTEGEAIAVAYTGRVVPVFCTSKRAEPRMCERSSAWVLKRLAEGKVLYRPRHEAGSLMFSETLIRWEPVDGMIEFCVPGEMVWSSKRGQLCFDGKILCRIARPSEVPQ